MASILDFFSDYQLPPNEFSEITSIMAQENQSYARTDSFSRTNMSSGAISDFNCEVLGDHRHHGNFPILCDHKNDDALDIFSGESEIMSSIPEISSLLEPSGVLDIDVPISVDYKMEHGGDIVKIQNFEAGFLLPDVGGYRENFGEFLPNFMPVCPLYGERWELEYNQTAATKNSKTKKVRYTAEERKERILRYLKKKNQRKYNNIKYACRKTVAAGRPRVRGRFAKPNEVFEEGTEVKKNDIILHNHQEKVTHYDNGAMQVFLDIVFEEER